MMTQRKLLTCPLALALIVASMMAASGAADDDGRIPKSEEILRRYIPASRLDAVATKDSPGVLLPIAEFEQLLKNAETRTGEGGLLPAGASLVRADYALKVQEKRLRATCKISLHAFDAAWRTLRLRVGGWSVLSASFEGEDAAPTLTRDAKKPDELVLLLSSSGDKKLLLELSAPLNASGGDQAAAFQVVDAPLGEMSLTLPPKQRLRLDGVLLERPAADDEPAEYTVAIGGRAEVRLVMTDRKAMDRSDAMTFASTSFGVVASPGEATWTARTQLTVFGRPLDKLECEVPSSLEITDVESQGLEAWQLNDGPQGRTKISLTWRQPFDGVRAITFRGVFSPDRDGRWHVPNLVLHNVSSHTGNLLLERPAGVRLQVVQSAGLRPVVGVSRPDSKPTGAESRYEVWKEDFALDFIPASKEREVQAAMSTLVAFGAQGADLMTTIDLETRFAPLFEADILIPAAWQILDARHGDEAAEWQLIPDEAGRNRIRIALEPALKPGENRTLRLTAHHEPEGWPVETTPVRVALPEVRLPQAGVVEALYGVTADSDLEVVPIDVSGLIPARQSDVDTLNRQLASFGRTVRLGFTYQDTVFQGQLEIRRFPARLTATCMTLTRIDVEEIASHIEAQLVIGGGGARELNVRLPESAGRDLRFVLRHFHPRPLYGVQSAMTSPVPPQPIVLPPLPNILEQTAGAAENGTIPWTIQLDRYALGTFVLQAEVSQPRAPAAAGQVQQWSVPAMTLVGADQESGAIGIEAADDQYIRAEARDAGGQPLAMVDPIDFPPAHVRPRERLVAAFAYERPGWSVTVSEERLTRIAMPTAVIHKLAMASIIGAEGVKQVQADATLSAVGVQSLVIRLPEGCLLWGALVDGRPIQVHKSGEALSLPLSAVDPPGRAREVRLVYAPDESASSMRARLTGFSIEDSPPRFLVVTGEGREQPLSVLTSQWTVHHADDLDLVDTKGVFNPAEPLERDSLLHRLLSMFEMPESGDALWRGAVLAAIAVGAWLLTKARQRLSLAGWGCLCAVVSVPLVLALIITYGATARSSARSRETASAAPAVTAPATADQFQTDWMFSERQAGELRLEQAPNESLAEGEDVRRLREFHAAEPFGTRRKGESETLGRRTESRPASPARPATTATPAPADKSGLAKAVSDDSSKLSLTDSMAPAGRGLSRGEGLLSVTFGLQPPAGSRATVLESTSDDPVHGLSLRFMDKRTRNLWTSLAALATATVGWWLRRSGVTSRLLFLLVTLLGPISMRWLLPLSWLPLADGVWLGGAATAALWLVRVIVVGICECPCLDRWRRPGSSISASLAIVAAVGWSSVAIAQDTTPKPAPASAEKGTGQDAAPDPDQSTRKAEPARRGLKGAAEPKPDSVFIPYDNPREPLSARNVFIPQELFLKLWRSSHPDDLPPTHPPIAATVSAAAFVVDATGLAANAGDGAQRMSLTAPVTGRLVLKNLTAKPVRLALPVKGVALRSAILDGAPATLESGKDRSLVVALERTGESVLDLQFDVAVEQSGPAGRIRWDSTAVPAGLLTLKLATTGEPPAVRVGGSEVSPSATDAAGAASFEIPIDRGGVQEIRWQPAAGRSGDDAPVQVQVMTAATIDDAGLRIRSEYTARVSQKGVTELTLAFGGSMNLVRVEGQEIGGWREEGEAAGRKLIVYFTRRIESQTVFTVEAFQAVTIDERPQTITVVPPQPEGVLREAGEIGVFVAGHLSARAGTLVGLTQQDAARFRSSRPKSPAPAHPLQLAYRYAARPISLELIVQRRQAETRADVQHGVFLTQRRVRVSTRAAIQIVGAPRSTVSLSLPPGYLLLEVNSPVMTDYATVESEGGRKILTVEFDRPRLGEVELLIDGSIARRPEEPSAVVAVPRLLEVNRVESQLGVWIEDLYAATADALGDWKNADPGSLDDKLRRLRPEAMQFGFRSSLLDSQPVTIGLRVQAAELSADVLSLIAVSNASVDYGLTMQWKITRAATDTFAFTTPGWLRGKLDFAGAGIRQVVSNDLPGDRVKWTVSLTDPVRESYLLTAAASLPSPADGRIVAPDLAFESSGAGGAATRLEAQRHFAVVVNLSRRPLALEDSRAVETVRRDDLPLKVPDRLARQAMNIVQILPGRTASWLARRVGETASLQATVTSARLETVIAVDGTWRTQATYTLRNRGRQFLPVDLSAMKDVQVLSILVKGKPARALERKIGEKSLHLVPLPPSSAADLSYDVVIMLSGKLAEELPKETSIAATTLELPAPHLTTPAESAQFGMPVAQTAWIVRLPDGVRAEMDDSGNLTPHQAAEWGLLADAQLLSRWETDAAEMARIVTDSASSEQRRGQAKANLLYLYSQLESNESRMEQDARQAESLLGDKGVEISRSNSARTDALKARVEQQLREVDRGGHQAGQRARPPAAMPEDQLPQLQGSLNLNFDVPANGAPNAPQSGEGRAYIIDNSRSILNSNSLGQDRSKEGGAAEFGFNTYGLVDQKPRDEAEPGLGKAPSRTGLKRKLAEQQQAAPNAEFSQRFSRPQSQAMGGIGGGVIPNQFHDGMFVAGQPFGAVSGPVVNPTVLGVAEGPETTTWSGGAGLSLAMTLPATQEDSLAFSKVGGSPKLVLKARSDDARRAAWGLAELAGAVVFGLLLLVAASSGRGLASALSILASVAAAVGFLFLPGAASWISLAVLLAAGFWVLLSSQAREQAAG